jgi:predicted TIM-barrel fold metal-dependent hydrolase
VQEDEVRTDVVDRRYTLISSDTHAGAPIEGYKEYLPTRLHDRFDEWAANFSDGWESLDTDTDIKNRVGAASFMATVNWDSAARQQDLEAAGIAQVLFDDIDAAVAEIKWAKENGLRGILLPADHHLKLVNLYYPEYDHVWQICEELDMPIHRHAGFVAEAENRAGWAAPAIGAIESQLFAQRAFQQLAFAGVFDRYPKLKLVYTETRSSWIPELLQRLDQFYYASSSRGSLQNLFAGAATARLTRPPSEYFKTNCYVGTFFTDDDIATSHEVGVDRLMWGADYPHHEGTWPHTELALRRNFANMPYDEIKKITSQTAAAVYHFDLAFLGSLASTLGPKVTDVERPLDVAECPESPCPSFTARFASAASWE